MAKLLSDAEIDLAHKQRMLRYNLTERGVAISLEEEVEHFINLWRDSEDTAKRRAAACLQELSEKADVDLDDYYTQEQWDEREEEWSDEYADKEADEERAWDSANEWEQQAYEHEQAREDWESHCAELGRDVSLQCQECNRYGCKPDCGEMQWTADRTKKYAVMWKEV